MPLITKKGNIQSTPHTEYYALPGILALEEIHGSLGFSGPYTRKLHIKNYPTVQIKKPTLASFNFQSKQISDKTLQPFHIFTNKMPYEKDALTSRKPVLFGGNTTISISKPTESFQENTFFKNGEKHELYFIQDGEGLLKTEYGNLDIKKGYYIVIPKGTIYQIELTSKSAYFLIIESNFIIDFPSHYLNASSQATLMAPIIETQIVMPDFQKPINNQAEYKIFVQHSEGLVSELTLGHHPFDIVGWEGALYPFVFDIKNQLGISREIHTAPPVRQTFQSGIAPNKGFSICSFIPQMEGWNEKDIPAPFAHSNIDSDEVMFFSSANYGARESLIEEGSITLHPQGLPHSPHGDAALKSISHRGKVNKHLAVMLDTFFENLYITEEGYKYADKEYYLSWYNHAK